jgi:hypothetical protein
MNVDKLKKTIFVVLLVAFGGIWAYNLMLFLPKSETTFFKATTNINEPVNRIQKASAFNFSWGYELAENIPDPFKPFYIDNKPMAVDTTFIIPEIVIDQPFKYIGLIKARKRICGLLADRTGRTYVVAAGDTLELTKITKVNEKYLKLKYQGKEFELELNE